MIYWEPYISLLTKYNETDDVHDEQLYHAIMELTLEINKSFSVTKATLELQMSVCPLVINSSECLLIIEPINHRAYWPLSLLTIEPIDHWAYRPSSLLSIEPIDHQVYQSSSLSTIEPIDHRAYQPSSLSTIEPIDHWAYWPSSLLTIEPIDLWSSFATLKPFGLLFCLSQYKITWTCLCFASRNTALCHWHHFDPNPRHFTLIQTFSCDVL